MSKFHYSHRQILQLDSTLKFATVQLHYTYGPKPFLILVRLKHKVIWAKICVIQSRSYGDGSSDPIETW